MPTPKWRVSFPRNIGHFLECMNFMRQSLIDPSYEIYPGTNTLTFTKQCLTKFFGLDVLLYEFQQHIASKTSAFTDLFEKAYFSNVCEILNEDDEASYCPEIMAGNLKNVSSAT
jgi:hypothetical protein